MSRTPNRETELSDPVSGWLISLGFTPYAEVLLPKYGRQIDLIGRKNQQLITVELKRSLTKHAIHQTATCDLITPDRYAAVATQPKPQGIARCSQLGIGLLSVTNNTVTVLLEPAPSPVRKDWTQTDYPSLIHKILDAMPPHGTAGHPCRRGEGPAQDCYDRIAAYRSLNPRASWSQIFTNVLNHYATPRSLASSMRVVETTRARQSQLGHCNTAPLFAALQVPDSSLSTDSD